MCVRGGKIPRPWQRIGRGKLVPCKKSGQLTLNPKVATMHALLTLAHILVCVFLIMVVLLQTGKGQDLASAFGGGASQTVFGSAGGASALTKATSLAAILFMVTSLGLAIMSSQSKSTMETIPTSEPAAPFQKAPPFQEGELPAEDPLAPATSPESAVEQDRAPAGTSQEGNIPDQDPANQPQPAQQPVGGSTLEEDPYGPPIPFGPAEEKPAENSSNRE